LAKTPVTTVEPPRHGLDLQAPYVVLYWPGGRSEQHWLLSQATRVGRDDPNNQILIPADYKSISRRHLELRREGPGVRAVDLNSGNGVYVNQQRVSGSAVLQDGDEISLGLAERSEQVRLIFHTGAPAPDGSGLTQQHARPRSLAPSAPTGALAGFAPAAATREVDKAETWIGREQSCDIVLSTPTVSRRHARLLRQADHYWIEDHHSANGTFVNGQRMTRAELHAGDLVQISTHLFVFQAGTLRQYDSHGMRVDVVDLYQEVRTRGGKLRLLDDIDLTVLPREFVAVVGGSGAGKSTLMNALNGLQPAKGEILLNGRSFYRELAHLRTQLGYVPQADILHTMLTVERGLDYAAQLRLPPDVNAAERQRRIAAVLDTVGMNTAVIRRTRIGQLSGGQRKRVSIAAELLADPKLFLLDEPTSGLDPGLEKKMMHTLRALADEGRTIILITHATANLVQVDQVAFLAEGRLVFFGPPAEALPYFEVEDFADTYDRLAGHGAQWRQTFIQDKPEVYQHYVQARQASRTVIPAGPAPRRPGPQLGALGRQLSVLTRRAISLLASDLVTLCLLLLLFPMTAALQLVVGAPDVLTGDPAIVADPAAAAETRTESYAPLAATNTFVFVMGLEAVLIGMYVPSNELIKERSIYLRERMVNLQVPAYLLSKVVVFTAFAAVQVLLYLALLSLKVHLPSQGLLLPGPVELFITLFLTLVAGIGLGLLVSAVARSADMAIYALVMMMFFQFFFSGTVFDLRGNPAEALSYLTTTRWALTGIGVTINMPRLAESTIVCNAVPDDPRTAEVEDLACINYRDAVDELLLPYDDGKLVQAWLVLAGTAALTLILTGLAIKRLDRT
jgi:ABC transport system ATP-binding/permease protein